MHAQATPHLLAAFYKVVISTFCSLLLSKESAVYGWIPHLSDHVVGRHGNNLLPGVIVRHLAKRISSMLLLLSITNKLSHNNKLMILANHFMVDGIVRSQLSIIRGTSFFGFFISFQINFIPAVTYTVNGDVKIL